ncbi:MAG: ferrochelatase [Kofleriaceae bacterium]|nr:ferrochelatase [Kofleriaceae bacterium]
MATGLLLLNLGTPDAPTPTAVRRYLREFLSDPRVLDMNRVGRALLLNLIILPFRPKKSAHAYQQVWDATRGSPLMYHSRDLTTQVAAALGPDWKVELAMRYGSPSIPDAMARLRAAAVDRIVVLPLFPQAASSSSGTAVARVMELAGTDWNVPALTVVPAFHDDPGFLDAFAAVGRPVLAELRPDHVLFSYHGLPERHMHKGDATGAHCLHKADCCAALGPVNHQCYRAHCYATSRGLASRLGLIPAAGELVGPGEAAATADGAIPYSSAFQSRLTKIPWIRPYTDHVLDELARRGVKRLAVFCPAFVADCLETLEEIGLRAREQFRAAGGDELVLVPSLNSSPAWVEAVCALARQHAGDGRGVRPAALRVA